MFRKLPNGGTAVMLVPFDAGGNWRGALEML
jgi:hypothetical protein